MDKTYRFGSLEVIQLAVLRDNYSYLLHEHISGATVVIDPAEDPKIIAELIKRNWFPSEVWNTHWHIDHCGGNSDLQKYTAKHKQKLEIIAYSPRKIHSCTREIRNGQTLQLGNLLFQVYEVPGHTLDHLMFTYQEENISIIFCGDTLFSLGCGRLFEGTAEQMLHSLELIAGFPQQTLLFCGHEYTDINLRFALSLEKNNSLLKEVSLNQRVPSTLDFELKRNPFLRLHEENFCLTISQLFPNWPIWSIAERLGKIRAIRDHFH